MVNIIVEAIVHASNCIRCQRQCVNFETEAIIKLPECHVIQQERKTIFSNTYNLSNTVFYNMHVSLMINIDTSFSLLPDYVNNNLFRFCV